MIDARVVLELFDLGSSADEIAQICGCTPRHVRRIRQVHRPVEWVPPSRTVRLWFATDPISAEILDALSRARQVRRGELIHVAVGEWIRRQEIPRDDAPEDNCRE